MVSYPRQVMFRLVINDPRSEKEEKADWISDFNLSLFLIDIVDSVLKGPRLRFLVKVFSCCSPCHLLSQPADHG
jgi:hypothetical protein